MLRFIVLIVLALNIKIEAVEFVLFTQPKTGTHLLIPILEELTNKHVYWAPEFTKNGAILTDYETAAKDPCNYLFTLRKLPWTRDTMDLVWEINRTKQSFLHLHAPYSVAMEKYLEEKQCINFFITRDPRDTVVSLLNHYKNIDFNDKEVEAISDEDERLLYMIKKESRLQTIHFMNWLKSPVCCVLSFEKLMGAHGGAATDYDAMKEMRKIAKALQMTISDKDLKAVYLKHFGHGWNFFKGKAGTWKEYFNDGHKAAIKEEIGYLLIELGYEKDLEW